MTKSPLQRGISNNHYGQYSSILIKPLWAIGPSNNCEFKSTLIVELWWYSNPDFSASVTSWMELNREVDTW